MIESFLRVFVEMNFSISAKHFWAKCMNILSSNIFPTISGWNAMKLFDIWLDGPAQYQAHIWRALHTTKPFTSSSHLIVSVNQQQPLHIYSIYLRCVDISPHVYFIEIIFEGIARTKFRRYEFAAPPNLLLWLLPWLVGWFLCVLLLLSSSSFVSSCARYFKAIFNQKP